MKEWRQMKDGAAWYSNLRKKRRSRIKIVAIINMSNLSSTLPNSSSKRGR
jgi:hypothetical protein